MLIDKKDERLRVKIPNFDFKNPDISAREVYEILSNQLDSLGGIGLSANQIGLMHRVFVLKSDPKNIAVFNPILVDVSSEKIYLEEGCLSFPGIWVSVKRPRSIKVRYADEYGEVHTRKFDGITARAFLHELDHLDGITFRQRATRYHWERAEKKV